MKKIISLILVIVAIIFTLSSLVGCMPNDGAPEGMQLVRGSDALGYYFYAPKGWVVYNDGSIAATYASKIDNSSVTFVEADMPEVPLAEYVASEIAKLPQNFETQVKKELEACDFGKEGNRAEEAHKIVYTYKYDKYSFSTMQIFIKHKGEFFIFTFTASTEMKNEEKSYYDVHLDYVDAMIKNFLFVDKTGEVEDDTKEWPEVDGYYLVSDKSKCYFDFYMPKDYTVDMSTSMVSVSHADGSNVNVSEATYASVNEDGYWKHRFEELELIADNVKAESDKFSVTVKGNTRAIGIEYSYTLYGKNYKVYQVLIVVSNWRGFVFTYTAQADKYAEHIDEAKDMLGRLEF